MRTVWAIRFSSAEPCEEEQTESSDRDIMRLLMNKNKELNNKLGCLSFAVSTPYFLNFLMQKDSARRSVLQRTLERREDSKSLSSKQNVFSQASFLQAFVTSFLKAWCQCCEDHKSDHAAVCDQDCVCVCVCVCDNNNNDALCSSSMVKGEGLLLIKTF